MKPWPMVAMIMPNKILTEPDKLIDQLKRDFPRVVFEPSTRFVWQAHNRKITYRPEALTSERGVWSLLHELGHARLNHADFDSDIELLQKEADAWQTALELATDYGQEIDDDYIQNCLDSYRDWLHLRSTCPNCFVRCLQTDRHTYSCHNCDASWRVTRHRLCRPYRRRG